MRRCTVLNASFVCENFGHDRLELLQDLLAVTGFVVMKITPIIMVILC
jgi:hypothetical protein